jgi:hypothetical protein
LAKRADGGDTSCGEHFQEGRVFVEHFAPPFFTLEHAAKFCQELQAKGGPDGNGFTSRQPRFLGSLRKR